MKTKPSNYSNTIRNAEKERHRTFLINAKSASMIKKSEAREAREAASAKLMQKKKEAQIKKETAQLKRETREIEKLMKRKYSTRRSEHM